ncbi:hypothetical protein ABMA77_08795 [Halobacteriovorax sp. RZ-1]|uniref:hypothetical protein n=1 Tax=Halobacteriovorax sp. RZ-1 TaxID=3157718 RepID=UPI00370F7F92
MKCSLGILPLIISDSHTDIYRIFFKKTLMYLVFIKKQNVIATVLRQDQIVSYLEERSEFIIDKYDAFTYIDKNEEIYKKQLDLLSDQELVFFNKEVSYSVYYHEKEYWLVDHRAVKILLKDKNKINIKIYLRTMGDSFDEYHF